MQFVQNFPFMTILLTLICAVVTSVLDGRKARWLTGLMLVTVTAMTTAVADDVDGSGIAWQHLGALGLWLSYLFGPCTLPRYTLPLFCLAPVLLALALRMPEKPISE